MSIFSKVFPYSFVAGIRAHLGTIHHGGCSSAPSMHSSSGWSKSPRSEAERWGEFSRKLRRSTSGCFNVSCAVGTERAAALSRPGRATVTLCHRSFSAAPQSEYTHGGRAGSSPEPPPAPAEVTTSGPLMKYMEEEEEEDEACYINPSYHAIRLQQQATLVSSL